MTTASSPAFKSGVTENAEPNLTIF